MSEFNPIVQFETKPAGYGRLRVFVVLVVGLMLSVAMGYLVITDNWRIAIALLAVPIVAVVLHRYPFISVLMWFLADPFLMTTTSSADRIVYWVIHRALPPATVIVLVFVSLLGIGRNKLPKLSWPELGMLGYIVVSLLSVVYFNNDPLATTYLFYDRVISPMCLYLVVRLSAPSEKDINRLAPIILFIIISQLAISLVAMTAPGLLPRDWTKLAGQRSIGSLGQYNAYGAAMVFSCLFIFLVGVNSRSRFVRNLYFAGYVLAMFGAFISFSRGAWLAIGFAVLGVFYMYPKTMIRILTFLIPIMLVAAGSLFSTRLMTWAQERIYSSEAESSALDRLPIYQASIRMFLNKPIMGWGYENFNEYDWQFYGPVGNIAGVSKDHSSHNAYLTLLAEQGLIGFFLFIFPLIWLSFKTIKVLPALKIEGLQGRNWLLALWLYLACYITINMFTNMKIVFGLGIWWATLGFIGSIVDSKAIRKRNRNEAAELTATLQPF